MDPGNTKWKVARVFVSSTFNDMHGERNYLVRQVFPELQDWCDRFHIRVVPVDLRWGVSDEDEQPVSSCLKEIDRCRPFFLGILGDRYGHIPAESVLEDARRDFSLPEKCRSVTHLEIQYGALTVESSPLKQRAAFFLRDSSFLVQAPHLVWNIFECEEQWQKHALAGLKDDIRKCGHPVFEDYRCSWNESSLDTPGVCELDEFGGNVLSVLKKFILDEFQPIMIDSPRLSMLSVDSLHDSFISSHADGFVGRNDILSLLRKAIVDREKAIIVSGDPGLGKSALMSTFVKELRDRACCETAGYIKTSRGLILYHFVGAAPESSNLRQMLVRLQSLLRSSFPESTRFDTPLPFDHQTLCDQFRSMLGNVSARCLIIVDAINQLEVSSGSAALEWLPAADDASAWPESLTVILSSTPGEHADVAVRKGFARVPLLPLSEATQRTIVRAALSSAGKQLTGEQMSILLSKTSSILPLYLVVACEELRVLGVYEKLMTTLRELPPTVEDLFEVVLRRLEGDHGTELVRTVLCTIACSRNGILLCDLLGSLNLQDREWMALFLSLRVFLQRIDKKRENKSSIIQFFHQQLEFAVYRRYLVVSTSLRGSMSLSRQPSLSSVTDLFLSTHRRLAHYFKSLGDSGGDDLWYPVVQRALHLLPYHQIMTGGGDCPSTLASLAFIEAKCAVGLAYELVGDYLLFRKRCQRSQHRKKIEDYMSLMQRGVHILSTSSAQTFTLAMSMPEHSHPAMDAAFRWMKGLHTRPWLRLINKSRDADACLMTIAQNRIVRAVAVTGGESGFIATGADDGSIHLYEKDSGEEIHVFSEAHGGGVVRLRFLVHLTGSTPSTEGCSGVTTVLVSVGRDRVGHIWDVISRRELYPLKGHSSNVYACEVDEQSRVIFTGSGDAHVFCWDGTRGCLIGPVEPCTHTASVLDIALWRENTANGFVRLASCGADKTVRLCELANVCDPKTAKGLHVLKYHDRQVNTVAFSPDGVYVVAGSDDHEVSICSVASGTQLKRLDRCHVDAITSVSFSPLPGSLVFLTGSNDNSMKLWEISRKERGEAALDVAQVGLFLGHTGTIFDARFSPDGKCIVSGCHDRKVRVWDPIQTESKKEGHGMRILCCAFSPDDHFVCTGSRDRTLKVWVFDREKGSVKETNRLFGHRKNVYCCVFSPDSSEIASGSRDLTIRIWPTSGKQERIVISNAHSGDVLAMSWHPFGRMIASASQDKTIRLWDSASGAALVSLYGHREKVNCVSFSGQTGERLVSGSSDGTLKLWDTKTFQKLGTFVGHQREVKCVSWDQRDGSSKWFVSGSADRTIRVWDSEHGGEKSVTRFFQNSVTCIEVAGDSRHILAGSTDCKVGVFEFEGMPFDGRDDEEASKDDVETQPSGRGVARPELVVMTPRGDPGALSCVMRFDAESRITCLCKQHSGPFIAVGDGAGRLMILAANGVDL